MKVKNLECINCFKQNYELEYYLVWVKDQRYRIAMTRLRLSSHNLAIETGRHAKPKVPPHMRLCRRCNTQCIDDEIHFLLVCSMFMRERQQMLRDITCFETNFHDLSLQDKFIKLLNCNETSIILQIGKYIYSCFQLIKQQ